LALNCPEWFRRDRLIAISKRSCAKSTDGISTYRPAQFSQTGSRHNVTIDWTLRESVRAHLRVLVKRVLRKHGYPPDRREEATETVLEQTEVLSNLWASG
jgi:hypothetical protein